MKLVGVISTAVLSLTLGVAAPVYAQQEEDKTKPAQQEQKNTQQEGKNTQQEQKSAQQQDKNTQQEQKSAQQQDKNTQQEQRNAQQQDKNNQQEQKNAQQQQRNGGGRIPADRFKASFGREHSFHVSQADYSNGRRFQYGGYSFGFVDAWPSNWLYTQDVYVVDINGVYYLCNPMYPGVNIALSFEL
jgi:phage repressor protein C with HTH and peptisase S24 domain